MPTHAPLSHFIHQKTKAQRGSGLLQLVADPCLAHPLSGSVPLLCFSVLHMGPGRQHTHISKKAVGPQRRTGHFSLSPSEIMHISLRGCHVSNTHGTPGDLGPLSCSHLVDEGPSHITHTHSNHVKSKLCGWACGALTGPAQTYLPFICLGLTGHLLGAIQVLGMEWESHKVPLHK